jgi:hypothetical protein
VDDTLGLREERELALSLHLGALRQAGWPDPNGGQGQLRHSRSPEIRQGGVAPDQRLPRWATHSCSAPPTAAIRSKSAS